MENFSEQNNPYKNDENGIRKKALRFLGEEQNKEERVFIIEAKRLCSRLETEYKRMELGKDVKLRTFGSTIKKSSQGVDYELKNVFFNSGYHQGYVLVITVHDVLDGKVLGFWNQNIHPHDDDHGLLLANGGVTTSVIESEGKIDVLEKGKGIAPLLNSSLEDILYKMPEVFQIDYPDEFIERPDIIWTVQNYNLKVLNDLKKVFLEGQEKGLFKEDEINNFNEVIKQKEIEQARWQSMLGENGKLGLSRAGVDIYGSEVYKKTIKPQENQSMSEFMPIEKEYLKEIIEQLEMTINQELD